MAPKTIIIKLYKRVVTTVEVKGSWNLKEEIGEGKIALTGATGHTS